MSKTTNYKANTNSSSQTPKQGTTDHSKDVKYFQHNGYYGENPNKVKKSGGGKGNWGRVGDEINDLMEYNDDIPCNLYNKKSNRRNSNHQSEETKFNDLQRYHS